MITTLDASHKCVLKNWETIDRMIVSREQVEEYLKKIASKALNVANKKAKTLFDPEDEMRKRWIALFPKRLSNWKNSGSALINFGIEAISVKNILHPSSEGGCTAWIYSPYAAEKKRKDANKVIQNILKVVNSPVDFEEMHGVDGYLFQKQLPPIPVEEFEQPIRLEAYFIEPMMFLIQWWEAHEKQILKALS